MTQHPKRPHDPAQLAKHMIDIASGEVEDKRPTAKRGQRRGLSLAELKAQIESLKADLNTILEKSAQCFE